MSFEQACAALERAGVDFQNRETELKENEKLQQVVCALAQVRLLNPETWGKIQIRNSEAQQIIIDIIDSLPLQSKDGPTGEDEQTPIEKTASAIAYRAINYFIACDWAKHISDDRYMGQAYRRFQNDKPFQQVATHLHKKIAGDFDSRTIADIQGFYQEELAALSAVWKPSFLSHHQEHERGFQAATELHQRDCLSLGDCERYQAIFSLGAGQILSQKTFDQVCSSDDPKVEAAKILILDAQSKVAEKAKDLDKGTREKISNHLQTRLKNNTDTPKKSLLSTVRMASRPLGRHFRPKRDLDNLPETYKVAEKSLKIAARLLDIPIVEITKAITGGKSEEFNTYGDLKKFMEKEQKHLRSQAVQETEMTSMTGPS